MVDRGGLRYPLEVLDRFSAPLDRFDAAITRARRSFARFRAVSQGSAADAAAINATAVATERLARAQAKLVTASKGATASTKAQSAAQQQSAAASQQQAQFDAQRARAIQEGARRQRQAERVRAAALRDQRREVQRLAAVETKADAARMRAATSAQRANNRARAGTRGLNRELKTTESTANRIAFTFRRLFGILAAFTLARGAVSGFNQLIAGGVRFNQQIQQSRIGIAGLIVAVGEIRDAQGDLVTGQERFTIATREALRQQQLLRQDSLRTIATFEELNKTFQVAVAPGLVAGLNLDDIRDLSVRVTQAAAALDVPLNQLSEEIRALLTGNITGRTTRIATALGITPDDIRNAKEQGNLAQLLEERFRAFGQTAEVVAKTLTGTFARLRGVFQELTANAAVPLVSTLTEVLQGLIDKVTVLTNIDGQETIILRPEVVEALSVVFGTLATIVEEVAASIQNISFEELIQRAEAFSEVVITGFTIVKDAAVFLASALTAVVRGLAAFAPLIQAIQPLLVLFLQIRITLGLISVVSGTLVSTFTALIAPLGVFSARTLEARRNMTLAARATSILSAAILGAGLLAKPLLSAFLDIEVSIAEGAQLLGAGFVDQLDDAITKARILGSRLREALGVDVAGFDEQLAVLGGSLVEGINRAAAAIGLSSEDAIDLIQDKQVAFQEEFDRRRKEQGLSTAQEEHDLRVRLLEERAERRRQLEETLLAIQNRREGQGPENAEAQARELLAQIDEAQRRLEAGRAGGADIRGRFRDITQDEQDEFDTERIKFQQAQARLALELDRQSIAEQVTSEGQKQIDLIDAELRFKGRSLQLEKELLDIQIRRQQEAVKRLAAEAPDSNAFIEERARLNRLELEKTALDQLADAEERRLRIMQAQEDLIQNGSFFTGISEGLAQLEQELPTAFERGIEIIRQAVVGLADFTSQVIIDAFDPTVENKGDKAREAFGRFLQSLARQLLQSALLSLLLGILAPGTSPSAAAGAAALSRHEGGEIPRGRFAASPEHFSKKAHGLHFGGRPQGIHPKDTVPMWAEPGEFMMRVDAVRKYGSQFMSQLNAGLIDPSSLRSLSAATGKTRPIRPTSGGFQTGGEITDSVTTGTQEGGTGGLQRAVVVSSENEMEKLIAGGAEALRQFLRDNKAEIQAG